MFHISESTGPDHEVWRAVHKTGGSILPWTILEKGYSGKKRKKHGQRRNQVVEICGCSCPQCIFMKLVKPETHALNNVLWALFRGLYSASNRVHVQTACCSYLLRGWHSGIAGWRINNSFTSPDTVKYNLRTYLAVSGSYGLHLPATCCTLKDTVIHSTGIY